MKTQYTNYQVVPYPPYQRLAAVAYRTVRHKPMIHALFEADVTQARTVMRAHLAATGERLSFTAFIAACLAKAVDEHKAVQAMHLGSKHLILFEDVDIVTRIEHDVAAQKFVVPYILRAANRKTVRELHDEIRAAQRADVQPTLTQFQFWPAALFTPFVRAFAWVGTRRPHVWKQHIGTVGLTAVGMFGDGAGWGIPPAMPTALTVTVGGIGEKQVVVGEHAAVREYLSLTLSFDHDVVDGAPAARFTERLKELIESSYALGDLTATARVASKRAEAEADGASEPAGVETGRA